MTKARTLADFISDGSPLADGTISVSEVSGAAPLASPTFTGTINSNGNTIINERLDVNKQGEAFRLRTGGASTQNYISIGRTGEDARITMSGAANNAIQTSAAGDLVIGANNNLLMGRIGSPYINLNSSGVVLNELGTADKDFRVESDNYTHMLFVDAGQDRIGIGQTNAPQGTLHVDKDIASGANYGIIQNDGTANTDTVAGWVIRDGSSITSGIRRRRDGASSPTEIGNFSNDGAVQFLQNNVSRIKFTNTDNSVVVNEGGADSDFRVESGGYSHALFVDASTNRISLGSSGAAPNATVAIFSTVSSEPLLRLAGTTNGEVITQRFQGANTSGTLKFGDISFVPNAEEINFRPIWNGQNMLTIQVNETTVNQDSLSSHDFRVESDSNAHMLFVDAGGEYVNVNTSINWGGKLNVGGNKGTGSGIPSSQLVVSDFTALRQGGGGAIQFNGVYDSGGNITTAGSIEAYKRNATSGDYGFGLQFKSRTHGGSNQERLYMDEGQTVFNDISANTDFRVESDNATHALFVEADSAYVKFGKSDDASGEKNVGLMIGCQSSSANGRIGSTSNSPSWFSKYGLNGDLIKFHKTDGTNLYNVGSISVSTTSTSYNTSSDYRLKENVVDLTGATTRLKQLEPKRFNFIADADTTVDGFLAHEVQSVVPEAITGTHNEVDADGNPVYQGIDQSKLVPLLVATIQELEARISALENA